MARASTFVFPSSTSTVVSAGVAPANSVGYFWSAARGDRVTQVFTGTKNIDHATLKVEAPYNSTAVATSWRLEINGVIVGSFAIPFTGSGGANPKGTIDASFAPITGPSYTVVLRLLTEVASGSGSMTLASAGTADHSLVLQDTIAPDTALGAGGPTGIAEDGNATFTLTSPSADKDHFQCSLDGVAFANCATPAIFTDIAPGDHTFAARTVDDAGNVDATPATRSWHVDAPPVCADASATVTQSTVAMLTLPCVDADGDPLATQIIVPPTIGNLGALDQASQSLAFAAPQGSAGTTTFTYRATSRSLTSNVGTYTITVPGTLGGGSSGTSPVDKDHDGFSVGQDCNDNNPAIHPGALEIKGNNIDENCDGIAEPFPTLTTGLSFNWSASGSKVTLTSLAISLLPSGWKAEIHCSGKGCSFKRVTLKGKVKKGSANVLSSLKTKQRRFKAKQVVEVWVSAPNFNTKVSRFVLKKGKRQTSQPFCALPGSTKVQKTCT